MLFYGFDLYSEADGNSPEMEELMALHFCANPDDDASDVIAVWEELIKKGFPELEIICHGYHENPTYALTVKGSKIETDWDDGAIPVAIADLGAARTVGWDKEFERFCKTVGLPKIEADWLIAAYLG